MRRDPQDLGDDRSTLVQIIPWWNNYPNEYWPIDWSHKSQSAAVLYPTMHPQEQKCAHLCPEWCIAGYWAGRLWDIMRLVYSTPYDVRWDLWVQHKWISTSKWAHVMSLSLFSIYCRAIVPKNYEWLLQLTLLTSQKIGYLWSHCA